MLVRIKAAGINQVGRETVKRQCFLRNERIRPHTNKCISTTSARHKYIVRQKKNHATNTGIFGASYEELGLSKDELR